jgi:hypothetical protein
MNRTNERKLVYGMTDRRQIQGTAPTRKDLARIVLKLRGESAASGMLAMRQVGNR